MKSFRPAAFTINIFKLDEYRRVAEELYKKQSKEVSEELEEIRKRKQAMVKQFDHDASDDTEEELPCEASGFHAAEADFISTAAAASDLSMRCCRSLTHLPMHDYRSVSLLLIVVLAFAR